MSTEIVRLIRDGEKGGRGYGGGGRRRLYTYRYTVTTRMTSALKDKSKVGGWVLTRFQLKVRWEQSCRWNRDLRVINARKQEFSVVPKASPWHWKSCTYAHYVTLGSRCKMASSHRVTDLEKIPVRISKNEAPTPLSVVGPLFISSLLFHLSRALLGAWRFRLFRSVYLAFSTG